MCSTIRLSEDLPATVIPASVSVAIVVDHLVMSVVVSMVVVVPMVVVVVDGNVDVMLLVVVAMVVSMDMVPNDQKPQFQLGSRLSLDHLRGSGSAPGEKPSPPNLTQDFVRLKAHVSELLSSVDRK